MTYTCNRCGVEVLDDTPGASFVILESRILTLEDIKAGVPSPGPEGIYAYCPKHSAYDALEGVL